MRSEDEVLDVCDAPDMTQNVGDEGVAKSSVDNTHSISNKLIMSSKKFCHPLTVMCFVYF